MRQSLSFSPAQIDFLWQKKFTSSSCVSKELSHRGGRLWTDSSAPRLHPGLFFSSFSIWTSAIALILVLRVEIYSTFYILWLDKNPRLWLLLCTSTSLFLSLENNGPRVRRWKWLFLSTFSLTDFLFTSILLCSSTSTTQSSWQSSSSSTLAGCEWPRPSTTRLGKTTTTSRSTTSLIGTFASPSRWSMIQRIHQFCKGTFSGTSKRQLWWAPLSNDQR